jgi:hypothetical protein
MRIVGRWSKGNWKVCIYGIKQCLSMVRDVPFKHKDTTHREDNHEVSWVFFAIDEICDTE